MLSAGNSIDSLDALISTEASISKRSCLRVTLKGGGVDDGCTRTLYHARRGDNTRPRSDEPSWRGCGRICYKMRMVSETERTFG
jgi:hypothetical protein